MDLVLLQNDWRLNWKNHVVIHSMTNRKKRYPIRWKNSKDIVLYLICKRSVCVSICFNCLFLVFFFHYYCLFVSLRKEENRTYLLSFCLCVSQRDLFDVFSVTNKNGGERIKKMEFPVCLSFRIICRLFLSVLFSVSLCCVFFMPPSVSLFIY